MQRIVIRNKSGQKIAAILHFPKKIPAPVVVVCHGFRSSKITKKELCNLLAKKGFVALRFDFNGQGESYGKFKNLTISRCVSDLKSVVEFVKKQKFFNGKIGITGTSMGGLVTMIYGASHKTDALVPVSPVFRHGDTRITKDRKEMKKWKEDSVRHFSVRTGGWKRENKPLLYTYVTDGVKYNMTKLTKKIKTPVLVIHGDRDKFVNVSQARAYFMYAKGPKKLVIIRNGGHNHQFTKKQLNITYKESVDWFTKYLKN